MGRLAILNSQPVHFHMTELSKRAGEYLMNLCVSCAFMSEFWLITQVTRRKRVNFNLTPRTSVLLLAAQMDITNKYIICNLTKFNCRIYISYFRSNDTCRYTYSCVLVLSCVVYTTKDLKRHTYWNDMCDCINNLWLSAQCDTTSMGQTSSGLDRYHQHLSNCLVCKISRPVTVGPPYYPVPFWQIFSENFRVRFFTLMSSFD